MTVKAVLSDIGQYSNEVIFEEDFRKEMRINTDLPKKGRSVHIMSLRTESKPSSKTDYPKTVA